MFLIYCFKSFDIEILIEARFSFILQLVTLSFCLLLCLHFRQVIYISFISNLYFQTADLLTLFCGSLYNTYLAVTTWSNLYKVI